MFRDYLILLLLGHILGDFYMQTEKMSEKKNNSFRWMLIHSLIYMLAMVISFIPVISIEVLVLAGIAALIHAVVDSSKYYGLKKKKNMISSIFVWDQIIHLFSLVGMAYVWTKRNIVLNEMQMISDFFEVAGVSERLICSWILGLLLIHKPANILIQNLIGVYKPKSNTNEIKADNNIGRVIGSVERLIMLILIYMNQYAAIGLVLTAKSIARDRIAKDEKFAEYYLLGTLISFGIVIICGVFLNYYS